MTGALIGVIGVAAATGAASGGGGGPGTAPIVTVVPAIQNVHKPGGGQCTFNFSSTVKGGLPPYFLLWDEGDGDRTQPSVTFTKHAPSQDTNDGTVTLRVTDSAAPPKVVFATADWIASGF